jgi:type I restriction enzyme, S subunit
MYCFQNTLIRYRASKCALPAYCRSVFKWWLDTGAFQEVSRQTTSVAHLGADRFSKMLLPLPSIDEQKRIRDVIRAHDSNLKNHMDIFRKFRAMKTALMQDLLTGERRVTPLLEKSEKNT